MSQSTSHNYFSHSQASLRIANAAQGKGAAQRAESGSPDPIKPAVNELESLGNTARAALAGRIEVILKAVLVPDRRERGFVHEKVEKNIVAVVLPLCYDSFSFVAAASRGRELRPDRIRVEGAGVVR